MDGAGPARRVGCRLVPRLACCESFPTSPRNGMYAPQRTPAKNRGRAVCSRPEARRCLTVNEFPRNVNRNSRRSINSSLVMAPTSSSCMMDSLPRVLLECPAPHARSRRQLRSGRQHGRSCPRSTSWFSGLGWICPESRTRTRVRSRRSGEESHPTSPPFRPWIPSPRGRGRRSPRPPGANGIGCRWRHSHNGKSCLRVPHSRRPRRSRELE